MIIVGITGGIASGKTTVVNFLKKKRIPTHDSDLIVRKIYTDPSFEFINYLKKISLKNSLKDNKINKKIIQEEIFAHPRKKKLLEKYIHKKVPLLSLSRLVDYLFLFLGGYRIFRSPRRRARARSTRGGRTRRPRCRSSSHSAKATWRTRGWSWRLPRSARPRLRRFRR